MILKSYKSIYKESKSFKIKNCEIKYSIEDDIVIIDNIEVSLNQRGKGLAKQTLSLFLKKFSDYRIEGHAYPQDKNTDMDKLLHFYQSMGFKVGSGDNKYGWEIYKD